MHINLELSPALVNRTREFELVQYFGDQSNFMKALPGFMANLREFGHSAVIDRVNASRMEEITLNVEKDLFNNYLKR